MFLKISSRVKKVPRHRHDDVCWCRRLLPARGQDDAGAARLADLLRQRVGGARRDPRGGLTMRLFVLLLAVQEDQLLDECPNSLVQRSIVPEPRGTLTTVVIDLLLKRAKESRHGCCAPIPLRALVPALVRALAAPLVRASAIYRWQL